MRDFRLQNLTHNLRVLLNEIIELSNLKRNNQGHFTRNEKNLEKYLNDLISENMLEFDNSYKEFIELKKKQSIKKEYAHDKLTELKNKYNLNDSDSDEYELPKLRFK